MAFSRPKGGSILLMHCYYWRIVLLKFFGTISWFGSVFLAQFLDDHTKILLHQLWIVLTPGNHSFSAAFWCNVWNLTNIDLWCELLGHPKTHSFLPTNWFGKIKISKMCNLLFLFIDTNCASEQIWYYVLIILHIIRFTSMYNG